jgi:3-oxoacyl-(acyl-carrier-protein) synthase
MARFAQYALAASEEALEDAGWKPTAFEDREATVRDVCGIYSSAALMMRLGCLSGFRDWEL